MTPEQRAAAIEAGRQALDAWYRNPPRLVLDSRERDWLRAEAVVDAVAPILTGDPDPDAGWMTLDAFASGAQGACRDRALAHAAYLRDGTPIPRHLR